MKVYMLISACPYYGDEEIVGIYSNENTLKQAKEIKIRCSRIDNYAERLSVDEFKLDEMPYDADSQPKTA